MSVRSRDFPHEGWAAVSKLTIDHIFSILATSEVGNIQSKDVLQKDWLEMSSTKFTRRSALLTLYKVSLLGERDAEQYLITQLEAADVTGFEFSGYDAYIVVRMEDCVV